MRLLSRKKNIVKNLLYLHQDIFTYDLLSPRLRVAHSDLEKVAYESARPIVGGRADSRGAKHIYPNRPSLLLHLVSY